MSEPSIREAMQGNAVKVLLIDDDRNSWKTAKRVFESSRKLKFDLEYVTNMAEALEHLAKDMPDVIVSELRLPDSGGNQTIETLKEAAEEVPIVIIGRIENETLSDDTILAGAEDYVVKKNIGAKTMLARIIRRALARRVALNHRTIPGLPAQGVETPQKPLVQPAEADASATPETEPAGAAETKEEAPAEPAEEALQKPALQDTDTQYDPKHTGGARILVVDDQTVIRQVLSRTLKDAGATVETAENGVSALQALKKAAGEGPMYDLVLLDLIMPDINGVEVLQKLRANDTLHGLPVIVLSSAGGKELIVFCAKLGIDKYLMKPIKPSRLLHAVDASLVKRKNAAAAAQ